MYLQVRVSKKDFESDVGMRYGGQDKWHHLTCFAKMRSELGYFEAADKLPGFKALSKNDQQEALKQLPAIKQEDAPEVKKIKKEEDDPEKAATEKLFKEQNKLFYKNRDKLAALEKKKLALIFESCNLRVPSGIDSVGPLKF